VCAVLPVDEEALNWQRHVGVAILVWLLRGKDEE
jgi:hypothetical protein